MQAVRAVADERPFPDDAPFTLANQFRIAAAQLPAAPTAEGGNTGSTPPQSPAATASPSTPSNVVLLYNDSNDDANAFPAEPEPELCRHDAPPAAARAQQQQQQQQHSSLPLAPGAHLTAVALRRGVVNQPLAPLGVLNLRR